MQKSLHFLKRTPVFASVLDGVLLLLALSAAAFCVMRSLDFDRQIAAQAVTSQATQRNTVTVPVDPDLQSKLDAALAVQTALNVPWLQMLNTLENVKKTIPGIQLLSIEPNRSRAEIRLKGETAAFEHITQLIEALSKLPDFKEVTLLNQHIEQAVNDHSDELSAESSSSTASVDDGRNIYVFEISMGWQL